MKILSYCPAVEQTRQYHYLRLTKSTISAKMSVRKSDGLSLSIETVNELKLGADQPARWIIVGACGQRDCRWCCHVH